MSLSNPAELYMQMAQAKERNRRQALLDAQSIGSNVSEGFNTIGQAIQANKKKAILDQIVAAIQQNGEPQQGPPMPAMQPGGPAPTSGMGAPPQDNSKLIQSLMTQYSPDSAIEAMQKKMTERPTSPWVVVPSMLTKNGRPVQENKETGAVREGNIDVTPTGRGNAAFGAGAVDWNSASEENKNLAKALYEGRVRPFDLSYRDRGIAVQLANQYALQSGRAPYKAYAGDVAGATAKAFAVGKPGMNSLALNTALGHLDTANSAYEALKNTNQAWLNQPINYLKKNTNDPNIVRLETALNALSGEAANVFKSGGATDQEISSWKKSLSENSTPQQAYGVLGMLDELMRSRLKALDYMREQGMGGRGEGKLLSPHAAEISSKLGDGKKTAGPIKVQNFTVTP